MYYAQSIWGMVRIKQDSKTQYYKAVNNAKLEMYDLHTDLLGNYQQHNLKTVLTASEILSHKGFNLTIPATINALAHVKKTTGLRGRWEWLQEHNPAGLGEVLQQWQHVTATKKHIVLGFVKDKDVAEALSLFPKDATYYFCNANIQRALPAEELRDAAEKCGITGKAYTTVTGAVLAAKENMQSTDALLITGSFFIVGEALSMWKFEN